MPQTDWLNVNDQRAFPLVDAVHTFTGGGELPRRGLADAGFFMGIDSQFVVGDDHLILRSVEVTPEYVIFIFRSKYSDLMRDVFGCYQFLFAFPHDAPFGMSQYAFASRIDTNEEESVMGRGFVTIGELTDLIALGAGVYSVEAMTAEVEPALIQSLVNTFVKRINLANTGRPCPPECECSSSSSSSSESSSSSSSDSSSSSSSSSSDCVDVPPEEPDGDSEGDALPETMNLQGPLRFKPGFNSKIIVTEGQRAIQLSASVGQGAGEPCTDLRTTEDGEIVEDLCRPCAGTIVTVNGVGNDEERFTLIGGPGVVIVPDIQNNEVIIRLEEEGICEVDI